MKRRDVSVRQREGTRFRSAAIMLFAAMVMAAAPTRAATPAPDYAHISSLTVAQLARICAQDADSSSLANGVSLSACNAYILGVADQLAIDRKFCLGSASYAARVVTEVRRFLKFHPERGAAPPVAVIKDALEAAFPCDRD